MRIIIVKRLKQLHAGKVPANIRIVTILRRFSVLTTKHKGEGNMTSHPFVRNWLHLIWATHNYRKQLTGNLRDALQEHLVIHAEEKGVPLTSINVQPEHVHCLLSLPAKISISQVMQTFKGESSRWINENGLTELRFQWNRGFGAFSISSSHVNSLKAQIKDQDNFHKNNTFTQEYRWWAKKYGVWRRI